MCIILILSKMGQGFLFFPKTNECRDILYNINNRALRALMAYINFAVFCLCRYALFTESSVYYVLLSFSLPNASTVRLKKVYVNSSLIFVHFQKHSSHEMHKLIGKKKMYHLHVPVHVVPR